MMISNKHDVFSHVVQTLNAYGHDVISWTAKIREIKNDSRVPNALQEYIYFWELRLNGTIALTSVDVPLCETATRQLDELRSTVTDKPMLVIICHMTEAKGVNAPPSSFGSGAWCADATFVILMPEPQQVMTIGQLREKLANIWDLSAQVTETLNQLEHVSSFQHPDESPITGKLDTDCREAAAWIVNAADNLIENVEDMCREAGWRDLLERTKEKEE